MAVRTVVSLAMMGSRSHPDLDWDRTNKWADGHKYQGILLDFSLVSDSSVMKRKSRYVPSLIVYSSFLGRIIMICKQFFGQVSPLWLPYILWMDKNSKSYQSTFTNFVWNNAPPSPLILMQPGPCKGRGGTPHPSWFLVLEKTLLNSKYSVFRQTGQ